MMDGADGMMVVNNGAAEYASDSVSAAEPLRLGGCFRFINKKMHLRINLTITEDACTQLL